MNARDLLNTKVLIGLGLVASAAAGSGAGYLVASKLLEKEFEARLEEEIQKAKVFYQEMYSTPPVMEITEDDRELLKDIREATDEHDGPPVDLVGQALAAVSTYDPTQEEERLEEEARTTPVIVNNIFQNVVPPGEEVLGALMADRDPSKPYIITKEEFLEGVDDFEQIAFTYWEGDNTLIDDRYEFNPIEDHEFVVGEENLLRFGYGSGDQNVLYVRNEGSEMDLHITKSTGKYAVEVMAVGSEDDGPHLEHSQKRFRPYHDD